MGCTIVALQMDGPYYQIAWVGDSRAYLWDGHHLRQLSHDHTYVQLLVDSGGITSEDAESHPQRNNICQSLGVARECLPTIDIVEGELLRGEQILLCSDGLTSEVPDSRISEILAAENQPTDQAEQGRIAALIVEALDRGGSDNVTVLLVSRPR